MSSNAAVPEKTPVTTAEPSGSATMPCAGLGLVPPTCLTQMKLPLALSLAMNVLLLPTPLVSVVLPNVTSPWNVPVTIAEPSG